MTRLVIGNLPPGTQHALEVRAVSAEAASEWSRRFIFTTMLSSDRPKAPTGFTWVVSGDSFHAEWDAVTETMSSKPAAVVRYEIELTSNNNTATRAVTQHTNGKAQFDFPFSDNAASFGTPRPVISARVRAVDNTELKSDWTDPIIASNPPPNPVTNLSATPMLNGISLSWTAPVDLDVTKYNVYVGVSSDFTPNNANRIYSGSSTNFVYPTSTYAVQFLKVRSVDKFNQESTDVLTSAAPGSPFNVDTEAPENATNFVITPGFDTISQTSYVDASWTSSISTDVQDYVIRYSVDGTNWQYLTLSGDLTSARIENLIPGKSYQFGVRAIDFTANESPFSASLNVTAAKDTGIPSRPAAPILASNTMQVQVNLTGEKATDGQPMESDVAYYEIYLSNVSTFVPEATNMIGTIPTGPAMIHTFSVPATLGAGETWHAKVIAVDRAGNKSLESETGSANVLLIANANIADATITNAKITNIDSNKITAGSGFINDLSVKSKFVLGDGSTDGIIESFGYVPGAAGFRLAKSGLEINRGIVRASAIHLQTGQNLMPSKYADFEGVPSEYDSDISSFAVKGVNTSSGSKFNTQYGWHSWTATPSGTSTRYFTNSLTNYNITVEENNTYIVSGYFRRGSGTTNNVKFVIKYSNGTIESISPINGNNVTVSVPGWERKYAIFTTPPNVNGILLGISVDAGISGQIQYDGFQVEQKNTAEEVPSPWAVSGGTRIDGSIIRTGSIRSNATATVWNAQQNPIYAPDGVTIVDYEGGFEDSTDPAWVIDTQGQAVFSDMAVRGRIIVGYQGQPTTAQSAISSANYIQGSIGWQIRGDGSAEFRQLAAESISGESIITDTLDASKIASNSVLTGNLTVTGGFETMGRPELVVASISAGSNIITSATDFFMTSDVGKSITGEGIPFGTVIEQVTNPTTAILTTEAIFSFTESQLTVYRGRRISINPIDGINIFSNDGLSQVISLPTDPERPMYIEGEFQASALTVNNNFYLRGHSNVISSNSKLTLSETISPPPTGPKATFSWDSIPTWVKPSVYSSCLKGLYFDDTTQTYKIANTFYGSQQFSYTPTGAFFSNDNFPGTTDTDGAYGGQVRIGDYVYILAYNWPAEEWRVYRYSRLLMDNGEFTLIEKTQVAVYGGVVRTTMGANLDQWKQNATAFNARLMDPAIGTDGTNILIARCDFNGRIWISTYTIAGAHVTTRGTTIVDRQAISSVGMGEYDFGDNIRRYYVTTRGSITSPARNYIFNATLNTLSRHTYDSTRSWPSPYGHGLLGTTFNGTNWVSLTVDGNHATYTKLGYQSGTMTWYAKSSWMDTDANGVPVLGKQRTEGIATLTVSSGHRLVAGNVVNIEGVDLNYDADNVTILSVSTTSISYLMPGGDLEFQSSGGAINTFTHETSLSAASTVTAIKRSKMYLDTNGPPATGMIDDPDSVRYYFSTSLSGTYYQQTSGIPPRGRTIQTFTNTPQFGGSTHGSIRPFAGTLPASVVSSNGLLELNAGGWGIFGSTQDASTAGGNKPPLRIGNINGFHMRIDKNELIAMSSDTTQAAIGINSGGQTNVTDILINRDINIPNLVTVSAGANVNWNPTNGRLRASSSSERFKENISPATIDTSVVLSLEPKRFNRNDEETEYPEGQGPVYVGFIAEEADQLGLSEWVSYDNTGPWGFDYSNWTVAQQAVLRKHQEEINDLKQRITALESQ